jgi:phage portal protein BeeE
LLHGDGFARIPAGANPPRRGEHRALHPLNVQPIPFEDGYIYNVRDADQRARCRSTRTTCCISRCRGSTRCYGRSLSPLQHSLRASAGIAIAADQYSASFFKNGARPDFAIKTLPGVKMTQPQIDQFRAMWEERYGGASNSHKPAVMQNMEVQQLTMTAEDSQLIATRQFQVEDIARIFRVPPHMIGHTDKTTSWGTGIEQMSIAFVVYTLQPHLTAIEQEINRKLFLRAGKFVEFSVEGLLRGDSKTRGDFYRLPLVAVPARAGWLRTRCGASRINRRSTGATLTDWTQNAQPDPTPGP